MSSTATLTTVTHERWCDPAEHARYSREQGRADLCAGRKMAEAYEGERHANGEPVEVRGQWRASSSVDYWGHPRFYVDPVGELTCYGVEHLLRSLDGVEEPRAVALRALLAQGLAEMEAESPAIEDDGVVVHAEAAFAARARGAEA